MRVCIAVNNYPEYKPGGGERWMRQLGKELVSRGHEVFFTTRFFSEEQPSHATRDGINVISYGPPVNESWNGLKTRLDFARTLYAIDADVYLNIAWSHLTGIAAFVSKIRRSPFIYTTAADHEFGSEWVNSRPFNRRWTGLLGVRTADAVVCYSDEMQSIVADKTKVPQRKTRTIYHGHPVPEIDFSEKEKRIIWMARFKDWKRPGKFLELADETNLEDWEFDLIGFGNPEREQELEAACESRGNLNYIGRVESGADWGWFRRASLFVNTSREGWGGFSNTFVQSWLSGTPVISRYQDPDNLIEEKNLGLRESDMATAAQWIEETVHSGELQKLQRHVRDFAEENFSVSETADAYEELFSQLV